MELNNNQWLGLRPNTWLGDKQTQMHEIKIKVGNSTQHIKGCNGSSRVGNYVNCNQYPHLNLLASCPCIYSLNKLGFSSRLMYFHS
jgi:hypothetical protein